MKPLPQKGVSQKIGCSVPVRVFGVQREYLGCPEQQVEPLGSEGEGRTEDWPPRMLPNQTFSLGFNPWGFT